MTTGWLASSETVDPLDMWQKKGDGRVPLQPWYNSRHQAIPQIRHRNLEQNTSGFHDTRHHYHQEPIF